METFKCPECGKQITILDSLKKIPWIDCPKCESVVKTPNYLSNPIIQHSLSNKPKKYNSRSKPNLSKPSSNKASSFEISAEGAIFLVIIILVILVVVNPFGKSEPEDSNDYNTQSQQNIYTDGNENESSSGITNEGGDSSDLTHAFVIAEKFVKNELKSPKTAEFGYYDDSKITFEGNDRYKIINYVDSENSYGANIRSYFSITLEYLGGDWAEPNNWEVIELTIE